MAIHLGVVMTVFAVGKLLFRHLGMFRNEVNRERAALVGAFVFAVHPLGSEAVNYARCSMIQLVTLFSMLASYHFLRWLERPHLRALVMVAVFMGLATWSKDPGIFHATFNVGLLCIALLQRRWIGDATAWLRTTTALQRASAIALGLGVCIWLVPMWGRIVAARVSFYGAEYIDHFLTQGRMFWGYVGRMILPMNLHSDHHIAVSRSLGDDPVAVVATVAVVALCLAVAIALFRRRFTVVCLLAALVSSHLVLRFAYPIYEHFVEYRTYPSLPWVGLIAGAVFGFVWFRLPRTAVMTAAVAAISLGIAGSAMRSSVWSSSAALAADSLEAYPLNNRTRCHLQEAAYEAGNYEEVLRLDREVHAAYGKLYAFNAENSRKREFDPNRALDDLLSSEGFKILAIGELKGSEQGIEYATERIDHFRENMMPGRKPADYEEEVEKALEALLTSRNFLETRVPSDDGDDDTIAVRE